MKNIKSEKGMIAVVSVLLIGAVSLILVRNISFLGLGSIDIAYYSVKSGQVENIANACAEDALYRLKKDSSFSGNNISLSLNNGSCVYSVSDDGDNKDIEISAELEGKYYYNLSLNVYASSTITINDFQKGP